MDEIPAVNWRVADRGVSLCFMQRIELSDECELRALGPEMAGELFALVDANRARLREWPATTKSNGPIVLEHLVIGLEPVSKAKA